MKPDIKYNLVEIMQYAMQRLVADDTSPVEDMNYDIDIVWNRDNPLESFVLFNKIKS